MNRSTSETVVLVFAAAVAIVFVIGAVGVVVVEVDNPDADTTAATAALGGILTALGGVTIGYVLGRRGNGPGS